MQMKQDGTITFTVNVKNTGKCAGAETVQLYIHDVKASVDRPQKELKGFLKVYLQPGESKDISITISKEASVSTMRHLHPGKLKPESLRLLLVMQPIT